MHEDASFLFWSKELTHITSKIKTCPTGVWCHVEPHVFSKCISFLILNVHSPRWDFFSWVRRESLGVTWGGDQRLVGRGTAAAFAGRL